MSLTIKARDARLSILGYQPEVKSIYWSHLPTNLPSYGQPLDLTGSEITAVYVNGEEAVVTDYCTFSPDQGAMVPNEPTMTVTATYTARSGKIVKADALLPIAIPSFIRIVVPNSVNAAKESGFHTKYEGVPTNIYWKDWFGWQDVKTYLFWTRNDEIVRITEVEATYSLDSVYTTASADYGAIKLKHVINEHTYDRYFTPTLSREVTCNAVKIMAEYTIYGVPLQGETYLEVDYIDHLELIGKPTSCPTEGTLTFTFGLTDIKTVFMSKDEIIGWKRPYQYAYPMYNNGIGSDTRSISIGGQLTSSVILMHSSFSSAPLVQTWEYEYSCNGGRVTWTDPNDD